MDREATVRCPRCELQNQVPKPATAPIEGGAELDGRPLSATPAVVLTWRWMCTGCGLMSPSVEAARAAVANGDPEAALGIALRAAWIADDHDPEAAAECRAAAAWLLRRRGGSDALGADLHRRNGDMDAALAAARRVVAAAGDSELASLAIHQLQLAHAGDTGRHSMVALFERLQTEAG
jgi:hypothetical protein